MTSLKCTLDISKRTMEAVVKLWLIEAIGGEEADKVSYGDRRQWDTIPGVPLVITKQDHEAFFLAAQRAVEDKNSRRDMFTRYLELHVTYRMAPGREDAIEVKFSVWMTSLYPARIQ